MLRFMVFCAAVHVLGIDGLILARADLDGGGFSAAKEVPTPVCLSVDSNTGRQIWSFVRSDGSNAFGIEFDRAYPYFCGLARIRRLGKYGFLDLRGHEAIPCVWDDAFDFSEGLAAVREGGVTDGPGGKWGYVRQDGSMFVRPMYDYVGSFSEGKAVINIGGRWDLDVRRHEGGVWGVLENTGAHLIDPKWQELLSFSEGLAAVRIDWRWGYIDCRGDLRISPKYLFVSTFQNGMAAVEEGGESLESAHRFLIIDSMGNQITSPPSPTPPIRPRNNGKAEAGMEE